jgi:flavin-dependent dehydrogenase
MYDINRADLHLAMFEYARDLGVECHLGVNVQEYFEENGKAGIIVEGKRVEGDLLIAAVVPMALSEKITD